MDSAVCETARNCNVDLSLVAPDHVVGVALVQPKLCYDELCCLDPQERMQGNVYRRLAGTSLVGLMYIFTILDVCPLPARIPVFNVFRHRRKLFFFEFELGQTETLLNELEQSLRGLPPWLENEPCEWCVRLPKPFAVLCGQGHWPSFFVCALSSGRYKGWIIPSVHDDWLTLFTAARWPHEVENIMNTAVTSAAVEDVRQMASRACTHMQHCKLPCARHTSSLARCRLTSTG